MPVLDSLFIKLGYDYDSDKLEKFNSLVATSARLVKGLSIAVIGLATTFTFLFLRLSKVALAQSRFGKTIGESRKTIEAFARASERFTGERGAGRQLLSRFAEMRTSFANLGTVDPNFLRGMQQLGLDGIRLLKQNPADTILEIANAMSGLEGDAKLNAAALAGLTEQLNLLDGLAKHGLDIAGVSDISLKRAEKIAELTLKFRRAIDDAVAAFSGEILPDLIPLMDKLIKNMPEIVTHVKALAVELVSIAKSLSSMAGGAVKDVNKFVNKSAGEHTADFLTFSPLGSIFDSFMDDFFPGTPALAGANTTNNSNAQTTTTHINVATPEEAARVSNNLEKAVSKAGRKQHRGVR